MERANDTMCLPDSPAAPVEDRAIGPYRVLGTLGRGGMAVVLRVWSERHGVTAMKLPSAARPSAQVLARFHAEATAMAELAHPNVPALLDVGVDPETGRHYLVMELARRGSLAEHLAPGLGCSLEEVARIGLEVCSALAEVHAHGMVHRDVKPGNLLVTGEGRIQLGDFGIAHVPSCPVETGAQAVMGSMSYMAPEQRERPDRPVPASDQYALGATLFALVTGRSPPVGFAEATDDEEWREVPLPLRPILRRATRIDPAERYPDARAMGQALGALLSPRGGAGTADARTPAPSPGPAPR